MSLLVALLLSQAPVAPAPDDIVILGKRTGDALAACIARRCSTPDDARISIAHAEALFAQGKYFDARATLDRALSRQRGNAAAFPRAVSALYEANATVNLHMGDMEDYRTMTIGQSRTLTENLPANDPQVLVNAIRLGDFWAKLRQPHNARLQYRAAAEGYAGRGEHRLAALTRLRGAAIEAQMGDLSAAEREIATTRRSPAAGDSDVVLNATILQARIDRARGKKESTDALFEALRTGPDQAPVLVYQPPVADTATNMANAVLARVAPVSDPNSLGTGGALPLRDAATAYIHWADLGFMVNPDGSVSDVEILRGTRSQTWLKPFIKAVEGRRYAPLKLEPGIPGLYRVERLTWRAEREVPRGSLIKQPAGYQAVETLDITRTTAAAASPPTG